MFINLKYKYDKAVDWWSLGCVMFEMLTGKLPFHIKRGVSPNLKIYENKIEFPKNINEDAKDFISKLLVVDPKNRLGQGPDGSKQIKAHPFFKGANWEDAQKKKIIPPFIPELTDDIDLRYFDKMFTDDMKQNNEYNGFTVTTSYSDQIINIAEKDDIY